MRAWVVVDDGWAVECEAPVMVLEDRDSRGACGRKVGVRRVKRLEEGYMGLVAVVGLRRFINGAAQGIGCECDHECYRGRVAK